MPRKAKNTEVTADLTPEEVATNEEAARLAAEAAAKEEAAALDFIAQPFIMSPDMGKASAPQRARDALQVKMDDTVNALHGTWTKAGRPSAWGKMVESGTVATYFVEPEKVADHKRLITRATQLPDSGIRVRWGKSYPVTEAIQRKFNLPAEFVGREVVSFAIMDKRPRTTNDDATAAQTDAMIADDEYDASAERDDEWDKCNH